MASRREWLLPRSSMILWGIPDGKSFLSRSFNPKLFVFVLFWCSVVYFLALLAGCMWSLSNEMSNCVTFENVSLCLWFWSRLLSRKLFEIMAFMSNISNFAYDFCPHIKFWHHYQWNICEANEYNPSSQIINMLIMCYSVSTVMDIQIQIMKEKVVNYGIESQNYEINVQYITFFLWFLSSTSIY